MSHDHTRGADEAAPTIERVELTRVEFRRGHGCCEESPVRIVTAYFDGDTKLFESDPWRLARAALRGSEGTPD